MVQGDSVGDGERAEEVQKMRSRPDIGCHFG